MNEPETRKVVQETVRETLTQLGLNVSDDESTVRVQQDFAYLRRLRVGVEGAQNVAFKTIIGTLIGTVLLLIWKGIENQLHRGGNL